MKKTYKNNKLYSLYGYFKNENDINLFKTSRILVMYVLLKIHKKIIFIQFFLIFFILNKKLREKRFKKDNLFINLFIKTTRVKATGIVFKIKNRKLSFCDIKSITISVVLILNIGWPRWSINNCLIIILILNNYIKNKNFNVIHAVKYIEKKILEETFKKYEK